jgi:hypothetical protein
VCCEARGHTLHAHTVTSCSRRCVAETFECLHCRRVCCCCRSYVGTESSVSQVVGVCPRHNSRGHVCNCCRNHFPLLLFCLFCWSRTRRILVCFATLLACAGGSDACYTLSSIDRWRQQQRADDPACTSAFETCVSVHPLTPASSCAIPDIHGSNKHSQASCE